MIPEIIHYCWFGQKPLPEKALMCIESWEKHCPDFKIKRWDESNYELKNDFVKQAYKDKNFAYVADYCRLDVLHQYGGIYLDTDMLVLKPLNNLLNNNCFFGFENDWTIGTAIIGAEAKNKFMNEFKAFYESANFDITTRIPNTKYISDKIREREKFRPKEIQKFEDIIIYPAEYFYPMPAGETEYRQFITKESYTVHLWDFSWQDEFYLLQQGRVKEATLRLIQNRFTNKNKIDKYYTQLLKSYPKAVKKWVKIKLGLLT